MKKVNNMNIDKIIFGMRIRNVFRNFTTVFAHSPTTGKKFGVNVIISADNLYLNTVARISCTLHIHIHIYNKYYIYTYIDIY